MAPKLYHRQRINPIKAPIHNSEEDITRSKRKPPPLLLLLLHLPWDPFSINTDTSQSCTTNSTTKSTRCRGTLPSILPLQCLLPLQKLFRW
jgi:hypothetical protein